MNINKFKTLIEKYYYSHGQHLIVDTWEIMQHNEDDCSFDVCLADSNISLFTIQNYNGLNDIDIGIINYFKEPRCSGITIWDGVRASYLPLYFEDTITLKTFKQITKKDIVNATNYFVHEILGLMLFNITFNEKTKEE